MESTEGTQRFLTYYPESYHPYNGWDHTTPTLWVDGLDDHCGALGTLDSVITTYRDSIASRLAVPSPLTISLAVIYGAKGDTGTVHVTAVITEIVPDSSFDLRIALTESGINFNGTKDQILRDYLPDETGIAFTFALGDTFTHSEQFVIDTAWVDENCKIVAFVQDDTTREVVQAVQGPVVAPPEQVANLTVTLSGDDLALAWSPVVLDTSGNPLMVDHYVVYRDTLGFFGPGSDPFTTTADTFYDDASGVVGNVGVQYYYAVTAVSGGKESAFSAAAGEFDKHLVSGK